MMNNQIDASAFSYSLEIYEEEFKFILAGITACYNIMINDRVTVVNDENKIRDVFKKDYLDNSSIRDMIGFTDNYHFERETPEDNDLGRVDIKIITRNTLKNPEAYYIIECKRLDSANLTGNTGLNAKYITDGIKRFVERKYSAYYRINGMIGFIVEHLDIDANITNINSLLEKKFCDANAITFLTFINFIKDFKYQYYSVHKDINNKKIKLYHLMFDFSNNLRV